MRWIIPGYDRVFIAPICAAIAGAAVMRILSLFGTAEHVDVPIAIGISLMLTLGLGPTLGSWRLTGSHRLSPGHVSGNVFVKL